MGFRKITRFRRHRTSSKNPSLLRRLQLRGGLTLLSLATLAIAAVLMSAPLLWTYGQADKAIGLWGEPVFNEVGKVESEWMNLPRIPPFLRGDEPDIQAFLQAQPLVIAIQDRFEGRPIWIRQGGRLIRAPEIPVVQTYRQWFTQAEHGQRFTWYPTDALPGEDRPSPKIVLLGDRWMVAKWWRLGSPEVEQTLRRVLGPACKFRLGLSMPGDDDRKDFKPQPWGAEPNLQVDAYRLAKRMFGTEMVSNEFAGWNLIAIPYDEEGRTVVAGLRRKHRLAVIVSILIASSLGSGLYLRHRARQRAALDSDRLASMTHSLKTPLAILKFRCDTIRLGRLSQDDMDSQLIRLGEEVDRLSGMIENGLMALQGLTETGPQGAVSPQWLQDIAEDLAPAFEAETRRLSLTLAPASGLASLPSLRAALLTLLENALFHGRGDVLLETLRTRKCFTIKINDGGPGLSSSQLSALGKPYLRIREAGKEGFLREGQGLGLSLMCKVAEREGWGLSFASEPGKGLIAVLEIANT